MTDLKDSSLSPLLQITSFDMHGHADNVLSENSFQGWMGYRLSTPRVGYSFNCCFIPVKRESKMVQERDRQTPAKTGIIDSPKQWSTMNKNSRNWLQTLTKACFFSVRALKTCRRREATSWRRGVLLLTQTEKNAWTVLHCSCDWIHFCGLDFVLRSYFRSLHVSCVVRWDKLCVCSVLQVWTHWAEHILLLCISHK